MKKPKPLISVIVPVYNVENYIARCIDSILAQTYPDLEVLLVMMGQQICQERSVTSLPKRMRESG